MKPSSAKPTAAQRHGGIPWGVTHNLKSNKVLLDTFFYGRQKLIGYYFLILLFLVNSQFLSGPYSLNSIVVILSSTLAMIILFSLIHSRQLLFTNGHELFQGLYFKGTILYRKNIETSKKNSLMVYKNPNPQYPTFWTSGFDFLLSDYDYKMLLKRPGKRDKYIMKFRNEENFIAALNFIKRSTQLKIEYIN